MQTLTGANSILEVCRLQRVVVIPLPESYRSPWHFGVLAEGQTAAERNSFNLGVGLWDCFGLPKTKSARHSWFWANARESEMNPTGADDLLGVGAHITRRMW